MDIRGWDVRTLGGRQLGSISDLLTDEHSGEVIILDVDLAGTHRHAYIPIRFVQIDRAERVVLMDSADVPESDLARGDHGDLPTFRAPVADLPPTPERRRADRRHIDRISTDL